MGFYRVGQAGLELLTSGDPPGSASQSAGMTGVSHRAQQCGDQSFIVQRKLLASRLQREEVVKCFFIGLRRVPDS